MAGVAGVGGASLAIENVKNFFPLEIYGNIEDIFAMKILRISF